MNQALKPSTGELDIANRGKILKNRFKGAIQFLKKTRISRNKKIISLKNLPWFLVIGPKGAGKTTLIAKSGMKFILAKQFDKSKQFIPPTKQCDWWVTPESVFVDTSGDFLIKNPANKPALFLWEVLLRLLRQFRGKKALQGVMVVLSLPAFIKQTPLENKALMMAMTRQIKQLTDYFGKSLPIYFVINQCDALAGFSETFFNLNQDETLKSWGVRFNVSNARAGMAHLASQFDTLIKQLNEKLIWRLHHEKDPKARTLIKDFPLQMESVKLKLIDFLKTFHLFLKEINFQGLYLTSATQRAMHGTQMALPPGLSSHDVIQAAYQHYAVGRSYFIFELFSQILLNPFENQPKDILSKITDHTAQLGIVAVAATVVVGTAVFLIHTFQFNTEKMQAIQLALNKYQIYEGQTRHADRDLNKILPLLNVLQEATTSVNQLSAWLPHSTRFLDNQKLRAAAVLAYENVLSNTFIVTIQSYLENMLQKTRDPEQLYTALSAYLLLGQDSAQVDINALNSLLKLSMEKDFSEETLEKLNEYLKASFHGTYQPKKLNQRLIADVRQQLNNISSTDLGMILLRINRMDQSHIPLTLDTNVITPNPLLESRDWLFTADAFNMIYPKKIVWVAAQIKEGNSILAPRSSQSLTDIASQIENQYLSNYAHTWDSIIESIQFSYSEDLIQLDHLLTALIQENSPLLRLLNIIHANTHNELISKKSEKLQGVNQLLTLAHAQESSLLYRTFTGLQKLQRQIHVVATSNHMNAAAFEAVRLRMSAREQDAITELLNIARISPDPVSRWLSSLAEQSWTLLMKQASLHVETQWEERVLPHTIKIKNSFPLNVGGQEDMSLDDFSDLFNSQGILHTFFKEYLSFFIDRSKENWRLIEWEGKKLNISKEGLALFKNIFKITPLFFPEDDTHVKVKFTLQPLALESNVKRFVLNVMGTQLDYRQKHVPSDSVVIWPASHNTVTSSIDFLSTDGVNHHLAFTGQWSWLKLLNAAGIGSAISRNEAMLTFDLNGHAAQYRLVTDKKCTPLGFALLGQLVFPTSLIITTPDVH